MMLHPHSTEMSCASESAPMQFDSAAIEKGAEGGFLRLGHALPRARKANASHRTMLYFLSRFDGFTA